MAHRKRITISQSDLDRVLELEYCKMQMGREFAGRWREFHLALVSRDAERAKAMAELIPGMEILRKWDFLEWTYHLPDGEEIPTEEVIEFMERDLKRQRIAHTPAPRSVTDKPGRNEPCPCGSGQKFKRCCIDAPTSPEAA